MEPFATPFSSRALLRISVPFSPIKLAKLLTHDKREAEKKKQQAQLDELEELRKKVALLEKNNNEG